jgi:hypothetical protein
MKSVVPRLLHFVDGANPTLDEHAAWVSAD